MPGYRMMNQPKTAEDVPADGASPDHNPTGTTPHGIPDGMDAGEANALPDSGRGTTETAAPAIQKE